MAEPLLVVSRDTLILITIIDCYTSQTLLMSLHFSVLLLCHTNTFCLFFIVHFSVFSFLFSYSYSFLLLFFRILYSPKLSFFFLNNPPPPEISPLPLHDALPI